MNPDQIIKAVVDGGGWAAFATLAAFVIAMFAKGKLVPGAVADAQKAELKELRELVKDDILPPVKEIGSGVTRLLVLMEFLARGGDDERRRRP